MSRRKLLMKRERVRRNHQRKATRKKENRAERQRVDRVRDEVERAALASMWQIWEES